jgi:hypothetical protein
VTPFFAAFFVVVNLHHYLMDTVIWRRDNPEMRYLRADAPPGSPAAGARADGVRTEGALADGVGGAPLR